MRKPGDGEPCVRCGRTGCDLYIAPRRREPMHRACLEAVRDELRAKAAALETDLRWTRMFHAGERVWVEIAQGDRNDGVGHLRNDPAGGWARAGDLVRYAGGTADAWPGFVEVVPLRAVRNTAT